MPDRGMKSPIEGQHTGLSAPSSPGRCPQCGGSLDVAQALSCSRCRIEHAEQEIDERQNQPVAARSRGRLKWVLYGVLLIVALGVTVFQLPKILSLFDEPKPLRAGVQDTDPATDRCIGNLWRAVKFLQDGKTIPATLTCPVTGQAYRVDKLMINVIVRCPNPGRHSLSVLQVTKKTPVPEAVR